jgi:hypothetical protein
MVGGAKRRIVLRNGNIFLGWGGDIYLWSVTLWGFEASWTRKKDRVWG